jgi:hypothetical protein
MIEDKDYFELEKKVVTTCYIALGLSLINILLLMFIALSFTNGLAK